MSSSSKQTELRRLMKLQLEKQQQQEKVSHAPPPPRGILKSTSKTTTAVKTNSSGVSSLLAAYEDDSDSDVEPDSNATNEKSTSRVSWPIEEVELKQTRIIKVTSDEQQRKRARLEPPPEAAGGLTDERIQAIQAEMGITSTPTSTSTQISVGDTETEDEFQALLDQANDGDDNDVTSESNSNEQANKETNEATSIDTTEMEQVSYQARIAQLRLKAAARRNKKSNGAKQIASVDTYTPELAQGNDEEDKDKNGKEKNDDLTPLEILRRKRLEAKRSRESTEQAT